MGPGDFQTQLDRIYELLQAFCKETQTPLHMDGITRNSLAFPGDYEYPAGWLELLITYFYFLLFIFVIKVSVSSFGVTCTSFC